MWALCMRIVHFCRLALRVAPCVAALPASAAVEAPLEAWLQEEGGGNLFLYAPTDLGRAYQVEWAPSLEAAAWTPAMPRPVDGTGGPQAFYLGQRPEFDGTPPVLLPRRDFAIESYADGTSLASWTATDGAVIRRRVTLDFRRVPRLANAALDDSLVVTRCQVVNDAPALPLADSPDPDPSIRAALEALAEAYPLLVFAPPDGIVRNSAETTGFGATRFWRVRRIDPDTDGDGVTDFGEWQSLGTDPMAADSDGDGQSDAAEVAAGTDPRDSFNGQRPTVALLPSRWGDVPLATPNDWLDEPLVLEVRSADGTPLADAPVTAAAAGGGLDLWGVPPAARTARPIAIARTDAQGRVAFAWRADSLANSATLIHAWAGEGMAYQGVHCLAHTVRSLPPLDPTVLGWLRSDAGVSADADGRVSSWSDDARSVTATATGTLRPLLKTDAPLPLLEFEGTQRLDFPTPRGGATMSMVVLAQPTTARTQAPLAAADPANRTPGLTGQKYLLAGEVTASASPWLYTAPVARKLQTTQYLSRYTAKFFTVDPVYDISGYNCREITYNFGFLPANLPTSQVPSVRYDITSGAIPDPGPPRRQSGKTYRLNPALANCPLKAGASLATCLTDFVTRRGLPSTYQWETRQLATYTRRAGNPVVDDFSEVYYEAKGYSPEVPEKYELQPGSIGSMGQGLSLGTNSAGYFQFSQHYAPALGSAPAPAGLALTSVVVTNGRPAFFTNGAAAGTSVAPAGGTATGIRHLGALANTTNGFVGSVSDIVLTSGALTDDQRRAIEDRLASRRRLATVDRDADTMPDWWERQCLAAGPAATPAGNTDGDSLTHAQERTRFTLPELADSDGDGLADGVESAAAAIHADTDNDGFLDGSDATPADPANGRADSNGDGLPDGLASLLTAPGARDSDGDTLSDLAESITTRTNPLAADTDGDSLPDGWESAHQLDPNNPAGADGRDGDPDGDGKTNAEERASGTHPRVAD